jgi:hypothetical protein
MERSAIRDGLIIAAAAPDFASLHPGYGNTSGLPALTSAPSPPKEPCPVRGRARRAFRNQAPGIEIHAKSLKMRAFSGLIETASRPVALFPILI